MIKLACKVHLFEDKFRIGETWTNTKYISKPQAIEGRQSGGESVWKKKQLCKHGSANSQRHERNTRVLYAFWSRLRLDAKWIQIVVQITRANATE